MIFQYSDDEAKRYHSWNYALRQQFGGKIFKVPVDAALTVKPRRNGRTRRLYLLQCFRFRRYDCRA